MCIRLFKRASLFKTPNHQIYTDEQNINVDAVVVIDKSSIKRAPMNIHPVAIRGSVFYVVRVKIVNNEDQDIVCSASLEGGILQVANAGWNTAPRREKLPTQVIGKTIYPRPVQISNNSFGDEPVEINSGGTMSGDFVFRIENNALHHRLKITVQCGHIETDVYNQIIGNNNGSLFEVNV